MFSQLWGNSNVGTSHIFATADAFALWKGVSADLNRGTMLTTSMNHPVGATNPSMVFFQDSLFNTYARIVHTYFNGNLAYALAYDDLGGFESGLIWQPGQSINIRINESKSRRRHRVVRRRLRFPSRVRARRSRPM